MTAITAPAAGSPPGPATLPLCSAGAGAAASPKVKARSSTPRRPGPFQDSAKDHLGGVLRDLDRHLHPRPVRVAAESLVLQVVVGHELAAAVGTNPQLGSPIRQPRGADPAAEPHPLAQHRLVRQDAQERGKPFAPFEAQAHRPRPAMCHRIVDGSAAKGPARVRRLEAEVERRDRVGVGSLYETSEPGSASKKENATDQTTVHGDILILAGF